MSPSAWVMLLGTWGVVITVTARLFWLVLSKPPTREPADRNRASGGGERNGRL